MLYSMVRRHGTVTQFPTAIHDEFGGQVDVAVSAGSDAQSIGIVIYNTRGRVAGIDPGRSVPGTVDDILSGIQSTSWNMSNTSMLEAVESAIGIVEQHFIMSALRQVAGNKKAAAELLGVSRQNFYTKFKRYGLKRP
jgi:DNA-binding NtrC family response regulator